MIDDSFIVHIPKKRMWEKINDILLEMGYNWDGASARKHWNMYTDKSCIRMDHQNKLLSFASFRYYKKENCLIFTTKDFMRLYNKSHGFLGGIRMLLVKFKLR